MSRTSKDLRRIFAWALVAIVVVGTIWGQDDHFPFGPMRMYSTTDPINGTISTVHLVAETTDGEQVMVPSSLLGLRPAEINGQVPRFEEDPSLLRYLIEAYANKNPDASPLRSLQIVFGMYTLKNRAVTDYREEVVVECCE